MKADLKARQGLVSPRLADLAALDDAAFRALFTKSPVKRIGRDRFIRNVLYAIANSGEAALLASVEPLLSDPSPIVRGAAVWALSQLAEAAAFVVWRDRLLADETDPEVRAEWATPQT